MYPMGRRDACCASLQIQHSGSYFFVVRTDIPAGEQAIVSFVSSATCSGLAAGINTDAREVSVLLEQFVFE
jgi:hypothetical protein